MRIAECASQARRHFPIRGGNTMTARFLAVHGKRIRVLLPGLFCLLTVARFSNPALYAPGMGAAIQGTVTESSGAVTPGATIAATNLETGLQRSGTSNSPGLYAIPNLPPGRYRVQVSMAGFQTTVP